MFILLIKTDVEKLLNSTRRCPLYVSLGQGPVLNWRNFSQERLRISQLKITEHESYFDYVRNRGAVQSNDS